MGRKCASRAKTSPRRNGRILGASSDYYTENPRRPRGARPSDRIRAGIRRSARGIRRHHEDARDRLDQQLLEGARERSERARPRLAQREAGDGVGRARPAGEGNDLRRRQRDQWLRILHALPHCRRAQKGNDGRDADGAAGGGRARQRNQPARQRPSRRRRPAVQALEKGRPVALKETPSALAAWIAVTQLLFVTTWTLYVVYLPQLAAQAGIPKHWVPWILVADQLAFAPTDLPTGFW